jgi:hypothetical protein
MLLGVQEVTDDVAKDTVNILLKYQSDIAKAVRELSQEGPSFKRTGPRSAN